MGVYGLWRLLDSTGKPVPLETLEGKVLAIDVSIWIHQVMQGYQDRHGNPKPNAHLLGLFHRICKLLYYKIKPVFVFDGGVPMLKRNTIASRRKQKSIATSKAQKMKTDLINNLIKHTAVKTVLNTDTAGGKSKPLEIPATLRTQPPVSDMFKLPDIPDSDKMEFTDSEGDDSNSSVELSPRKQTKWMGNIHNVDVSSAEFKALPADVRYDILTDLKETRKQNSWGRLHEMPEETHEFSGFQMKRLLKRRLVQECLESAEKEMGGKTLTLDELDKLLTEQGISTKGCDAAYRIAADSTTRLIYISDKNAYIKNSTNEIDPSNGDVSNDSNTTIEPVAGPSKLPPILEDMNEYELNDEWDSDIEITATGNSMIATENETHYEIDSDIESVLNETGLNESRPLAKKYFGKNVMNPALTYMLEYSGLTQKQILTLLEQNRRETREEVGKSSKKSKQSNSSTVKNIQDNLEKNEQSSKCKDDAELQDSDRGIKLVPSNNLSSANDLSAKDSDRSRESEKDDTVVISDTEEVKQSMSVDKSSSVIEATAITIEHSTDSDSSGDFIEIKDVPVPYANSTVRDIPKQSIQISFRSDQKIEDDIFADVFATTSDKLNRTTSWQDSKQPYDSGDRSQEEMYPEKIDMEDRDKTIEKLPEEQVEGTQLPNVVGEHAPDGERVKSDTSTVADGTSAQKDQRPVEELHDLEEANTEKLCPDEERRVSPLPVNEDELLSLKSQLEDEQEELTANIGKFERQATDISDQIRVEAQELLRLFGIPYIVAPMEAEAQCAYLEQIRLTDGTITDDSDIWLFGGQCVYKNFFNNNKRVLQFRSYDIQHHFKLTRSEMIQLALLVGSDYTTGLPGIGPVTALEILAAFPTEGDNLLRGLMNFCSWIRGGKLPGPGRTGLRNKLRNVQIEKGFPSQAVVQAYLFPTIDESKEGFTWGKPNIVLLSDYTRLKFGWSKSKFDEIMKPVSKRLEETKSQKGIDKYFQVDTVPKSIETNLSKRVLKAVQRLHNEGTEDTVNVNDTETGIKKRKSKVNSEKQKKQKEDKNGGDARESSDKLKTFSVSEGTIESPIEYIPQREKDRAEALKKKLHAIEVIRKSKQGLYKTKKVKRCVRKVKKEAELSESDSDSS